VNKHNGTYYCI